MDLAKRKIGIWGYGITGKSAIPFFRQLDCEIGLIEKRALIQEELEQIARDNVTLWPYEQLEQFFMAHDAILTSGSIDLRPYKQYAHKWLAEVDIIQQFAAERLGNPTVIAITGTVGKTTVTRLLAHILKYAGYRVAVGGNVGVGMLSLLSEQTKVDYLILELSSYQLEISKTFAPDVAVWTNFYPNHLDRHGSEQAYFDAKARIFAYQTAAQFAVMPAEVASKISTRAKIDIEAIRQQVDFHTPYSNLKRARPSPEAPRRIEVGAPETRVPFQGEFGVKGCEGHSELQGSRIVKKTDVTYPENIVIIENILRALNLNPQLLEQASPTFERDEHRLEKVATINGIDIYNDSKSTVPQATIAAVQALRHKPIILLLGGVSKGVDRSSMMLAIKQTSGCIKTVICFGGEAVQLHQMAQALRNVPALPCATLDEAWTAALSIAKAGDQVLLSPAGASFDLFKDYQERGNMFKMLVHQSQQEKGSL